MQKCEARRHFSNKKKKYLKAKIDEMGTNSMTRISKTCIAASMTLRWVTSLEHSKG